MLQYTKSPVFDDYFDTCLGNTVKRIQEDDTSEDVKIVLLGNFLSAFIYNADATFEYLAKEELVVPVFEELFTLDRQMFHDYQRKLYLVGLGECLFSTCIPDIIQEKAGDILSKMILMLGRMKFIERHKERGEQEDDILEDGKHKIQNPASVLSSLSPHDEEKGIEEELKGINSYYGKEAEGGLIKTQDTAAVKGPFEIHHEGKA